MPKGGGKHKIKVRSKFNRSKAVQKAIDNEGETSGFDIGLVQKLGGNEDDYNLIKDVEDDPLKEDLEVKDDGENISQQEIAQFLKSLGINKSLDSHSEKKKEQKHKSSKEAHEQTPTKSKIKPEVLRKLTKSPVYKTYLFKPGGKWHEKKFNDDPVKFQQVDDEALKAFKSHAAKLYGNEVQLYKERKDVGNSSKLQWMNTVISAGVLADKVAVLTLQIQDCILHNLSSLDMLLQMVNKKGRREVLIALDNLKQLWLEELLIHDQKLKLFSQHPFDQLHVLCGKNKEERDKRLLIWYFEDALKKRYSEFVKTLEILSQDTVQAVKTKALSTMQELLVANPEQEQVLLGKLVNKVGDPESKVASKAVYLLQKLVSIHPIMKCIVVQEMERMLYRPNISSKAQYFGICFLNQVILSHDEEDLATKLMVIYFSFFKACTKKKKVDHKMMSAVLTGVNRAYPYAKIEDDKLDEQTDMLFKMVHTSPFSTSVQCLLLLHQVMCSRQSTSDRYYCALFKKLLDPELKKSPRLSMFLNLLYQSLKGDVIVKRIKAFIKRLLQISCQQQPPSICAILFLISEVIQSRPQLTCIIDKAMDSDDEEHFVDVDEEDEEENKSKSKTDQGVLYASNVGEEMSWLHKDTKQKQTGSKMHYDPLARNPLFSGSEDSVYWELRKLSHHFHPSVALFATHLLAGDPINYMGNPLQDFTLIRFLDRFVYRNPKSKETERVSVMQPRTYVAPDIRRLVVNSKEFLDKDENSIPMDELFFYKYFELKSKKAKKKVKEVDDIDSDASSVSDNEFENYLDDLESGEIDDDVDFARDFHQEKRGKKKKQTDSDGSDFSDEDLDDPDIDDFSDDDIEQDFGLDDFKIENEDFDEEAFDMSDDDDEFNLGTKMQSKKAVKKSLEKENYNEKEGSSKTKKRKPNPAPPSSKSKKPRAGSDVTSVAEEFSLLMDENVGSRSNSIGTNALSNKDKAGVKQLDWEVKRDKWMRGKDVKTMMRKKREKSNFRKKMKGKGSKKFKRK
ncbi:CCAAT/enhancer-binding protein zeta-like [Anneissia japonica]|uniref:CCAAT/enhancer-binding protein zeta-like n=1 Tax=Anneissia japonica TaxID=1529436 RepID=UPI0014255810|nr:CCAAT/enhancer-binding protein zeta-like [Anneissia japonica]